MVIPRQSACDRNAGGEPVTQIYFPGAILAENITIRTQPQAGEYINVPVIVAPIQDSTGSAMAAIGVVDVTGIFDLADLMSQQSQIISQLRYCPVPASK